MLKGKKLASMLAVTAMLTSFGLTGIVEGASRAELAAIHVNQSENFQYWNATRRHLPKMAGILFP